MSEIGGPAYADSANVGMTDLVAALRWVRDNIANFGGDPDRVMIYGQSGGGSKVTTLLGMPSAQGLVPPRVGAVRRRRQSARAPSSPESSPGGSFAELGVKDIAALQKMEWARLNEVGNAVIAKMNPPLAAAAGPIPDRGTPPRVGWGPTVDGRIVTMRSFFEGAPEISKNVPMLIGSVSEEGNRMSSRPTEAEWLATLTRSYGDAKAAAIVAALKKAYPDKSIRTLSYMCSGAGLNGLAMRNNVTRMATMKHEQQGAPVFAWYFTWQSPMLEDAGAWHTAELAFCFDNTARCAQGTGNGPEAQALAQTDGDGLGELRAHGQSQPAGSAVDAVHTRRLPDDGLRRDVSHRQRSGGRGPEGSTDLNHRRTHPSPEKGRHETSQERSSRASDRSAALSRMRRRRGCGGEPWPQRVRPRPE